MDKLTELSDNYLKDLKEILHLPNDFKFDDEHKNTRVEITPEIENLLKKACRKACKERSEYPGANPYWPSAVLKNYFGYYYKYSVKCTYKKK